MLKALDWAVKNATDAGLSVIIDLHENNFCGLNSVTCRQKMQQFWSAVSVRYKNAPASVSFEILNEPHGQMNAIWNDVVAEDLAIIRRSNPDRMVVIGPCWSDSADHLTDLKLPEDDRRILVTFHYYDPKTFTHQGAPWLKDMHDVHGVTWGTQAERATLALDFAAVARWGASNRRPILLGEFGAYDGSGTPVDQRAAYDGAVAREAEHNGFSWSYWRFEGDFIAFDIGKDQWVAPILHALIPPATTGH
jgi:endoglucanase